MAININGTKQQRHALELYLSNGGDKIEAYRLSRSEPPNVSKTKLAQRAYHLFSTPTMKKLMAEADFQAKLKMERRAEAGLTTAIETYGISKERIMAELAKIAFATQTDVASWGPDGVLVKNSDEIGDAAAAVSEVSQSGGGDSPVSVKIKMLDKQQALINLGREAFGMFNQKVEHKGVVAVAAKFVIEK